MRRLLIALLFAGASASTPGQDVRKAPVLALRDLHGRTLRLSDYKGKVVLLNFWATWCPPCRKEIPDLIKMQREYRRDGLQVIGITYPPERKDRVRGFVKRLRINYPVTFGSKKTKFLFDQSETLPITIIIDRNGDIREVIEGIIFPEEFEQKIKPLLH